MSTIIKKENYVLKGERICATSLSSISDNFLLFIFLLIFSHSAAHGSQAFRDCDPYTSEDLSKSILNKFFFTSLLLPTCS